MSVLSKLSNISRARKIQLFNTTFMPTKQMRLLDLGAEINPNGDRHLQLIDSYPWKSSITAANISAEQIRSIKDCYPEVTAIVADACELPWPDKYFDVLYCNAVIEHVGDFDRQKKMAAEIMRVAKRWFVTTPNRWYPFEFHLRLPLVTWLPGNAYLQAGRAVRYNHLQCRYTYCNSKAGIRLMSAKELQSCFPDSTVVKQRVTFMAETLIVVSQCS